MIKKFDLNRAFAVLVAVAAVLGSLLLIRPAISAAPLYQEATGFTSVRISNDLTVVDDTTLTDDVSVGGDLTVSTGVVNVPVNTEHIGMLSVISQSITYTAAAGGSGTVVTIGDGEVWLVHSVFTKVITDFDATGDDATFTVGDGNDADGFIVAADANLQASFTEATGFAAGWYGIENGSAGAYTTDDGGPFVYAPSGSSETIDYVIDETSGETLSNGTIEVYVLYTRIQ